MISLPFGMILKSVLFSALTGLTFGAIYSLLCGICTFLFSVSKLRGFFGNGILHHLFDFVFTIFVGIVFLLLSYVSTDGIFSIYSLFVLVVAFLTGKHLVCKIFQIR